MPISGLTDPGNERFISPSRLVVARERRCFTQKALSKLIGVTPDSICKYESGECNPLPDKIARLAMTLAFPVDWFFAPEIELVSAADISFRSLRSMTGKTRDRVSSIAHIAAGVVSPAVRKRFKLPALEVPDLSSHTPEEAARILRNEWRLGQGPIDNMIHLLELKGIEVYWLNEQVDHMDAWSFRRDERAFVAFNTHKTAGEREQFDAAHELGHLVLHHAAREFPIGRDAEKEAHRFAGAFLLPAEQFRFECPRVPILDAFLPLKKKWKVSISAMLYRCKDLGVFTEWHYQILMKELTMRGWRKNEPLPHARQESRVHHILFEKLLEKGTSPDRFAQALLLPSPEFFEMMPVARQYLDVSVNQRPAILSLPSAHSKSKSNTPPSSRPPLKFVI